MASYENSYNLNDLAIFVEIAKRRNISKTAEVTGVPSSTLSRRLGILEAHLGVQLLARSTRKMALTEAGRLYFDRCKELIELAFNAREALQEEGRRPRGKLKVMLPGPLEPLSVARVVSDMVRTSPELSIECDYCFGEADLANREFDVALRWGAQADIDLTARVIGFYPFHLFASREYVARFGNPQTLLELQAHECLVSDGCQELSVWSLERKGTHQAFKPRGHLRANSLDMTRRFAAAGAGIAALPFQAEIRDSLVRVMESWSLKPVPLYAIYGSRTPRAGARAFVSELIKLGDPDPGSGSLSSPDKNVRLPSRSGQPRVSKVEAWS